MRAHPRIPINFRKLLTMQLLFVCIAGRAPVHSRGLPSRSPRSVADVWALEMPAASAGALGADRIICLKTIYTQI